MTSPSDPDALKTRAGRLLYRELPEEYRYRDTTPEAGELKDLEAYLHGFGHVFDLIRQTTEQAYADGFAETADNGRSIQPWLTPYLAELVGATLRAPNPDRRGAELAEAVSWFKSRGTLGNLDEISDTLSGLETSLREGWRHTLTTPRLAVPPFSSPPRQAADPGDDAGARTPYGTPDLRRGSRAVRTSATTNPTYRTRFPRRDADGWPVAPETVYWRPSDRSGTPCFPGSYDDVSARTPDLRTSDLFETANRHAGPHPKRIQIHIRPPWGLFEPGLRRVTLPAGPNPLGFDLAENEVQTLGPLDVLKALGEALPADTGRIDKIEIDGDLTLPAGVKARFHNCLFLGTLRTNTKSPLRLERCAARKLIIEAQPQTRPALIAEDCLFDEIMSPFGFAQLEHVTVLGETHLKRLWASDCLFNGDLIGISCNNTRSCLRYSRFNPAPDLQDCANSPYATNTTDGAVFLPRRGGPPDCALRLPAFGEPGCGVLDLITAASVCEGAENQGEMGVGNHLYHCAQLRALHRKLHDFLPLGQEVALIYDAQLDRPAVKVTS